jgi:hypothetical protein
VLFQPFEVLRENEIKTLLRNTAIFLSKSC